MPDYYRVQYRAGGPTYIHQDDFEQKMAIGSHARVIGKNGNLCTVKIVSRSKTLNGRLSRSTLVPEVNPHRIDDFNLKWDADMRKIEAREREEAIRRHPAGKSLREDIEEIRAQERNARLINVAIEGLEAASSALKSLI